MRRRLFVLVFLVVLALVMPAAALAHEAPQNEQSSWVMADWMMDTFFVFSGLALVAFIAAWKAGAFHDLESHGSIPLYVQEEDYYTPDWALSEEEWL
jgi:predicted ABC-type exoprotein transport system permease subunit